MRDRLPQPGKEGWVKLTGVTIDPDGTIHGKLDFADDATQAGSAYNKANVLPDSVCGALGIDRVTSEPKDALLALKNRYVVGSYVGDGTTASRLINLGFSPSLLIVFRTNADGEPSYTKAYTSAHFMVVHGAISASVSAGSGAFSVVTLVGIGFSVAGSGSSGTYVKYYNEIGRTYGYIAWR